MKKALLALTAAAALVLAVVVPLNSKPARATAAPAPAAAPQEHHPEMRAAIHHLEQAKDALEKAAHDYGGHRAKAIEHVNQALEECHRALESDQR